MKRRKSSSRRVGKKRSMSRQSSGVITLRRIIIFGGISILLLSLFPNPVKKSLSQSVAGVSIARPLFAQATVSWEKIEGAASYNVYYKKKSDGDFTHAVRNLPPETLSYTISYLRKGADYEYKIAASDAQGREYFWSSVEPITNLQSMQ